IPPGTRMMTVAGATLRYTSFELFGGREVDLTLSSESVASAVDALRWISVSLETRPPSGMRWPGLAGSAPGLTGSELLGEFGVGVVGVPPPQATRNPNTPPHQ